MLKLVSIGVYLYTDSPLIIDYHFKQKKARLFVRISVLCTVYTVLIVITTPFCYEIELL